ncbi:isopenicillin N synthase-like dioxygenase [Asanoa ferruginea]|uniref:Isopenicillin N synthase-like dioxygenase n=1 Tax=Asanoa ferruginea TaxID=53367 RepID=A0A3D9ZDE5_9ACTN|nr:2-oxoglutarate and iron-dependent oxygenase domain-containing protein [Asanoa ferruginea]REF95428.1 isopenicillin N synthase-like dioxygenase [Asanoa ferruginea]
MTQTRLPVIDVEPLRTGGDAATVAREIESACRDTGFFYVAGHGVPAGLVERLDAAARTFFARPDGEKLAIAMRHAGPAWRGYFPLGGELTAGRPDRKEGLYFGEELTDGDPRAGLPLHGRNLFPPEVPELRAAVLDYLAALTAVAQDVLRGVALSLDLPADYFAAGYTRVPTVLFRIFHYPPQAPEADDWGVGEHTDYGLLTLLAQDQNGGLSVRTPSGWVDAPPLPGTFVCNIGDMLERLTGGWYRSTLHRVRNVSGNERLSYPFFFDPDFRAEVPPLPGRARTTATGEPRWDGADPVAFTGTYGDYLTAKVAKVFPDLFAAAKKPG